MAYLKPDKPEKVYVPALRAAKEKGDKLVCLTADDDVGRQPGVSYQCQVPLVQRTHSRDEGDRLVLAP